VLIAIKFCVKDHALISSKLHGKSALLANFYVCLWLHADLYLHAAVNANQVAIGPAGSRATYAQYQCQSVHAHPLPTLKVCTSYGPTSTSKYKIVTVKMSIVTVSSLCHPTSAVHINYKYTCDEHQVKDRWHSIVHLGLNAKCKNARNQK